MYFFGLYDYILSIFIFLPIPQRLKVVSPLNGFLVRPVFLIKKIISLEAISPIENHEEGTNTFFEVQNTQAGFS